MPGAQSETWEDGMANTSITWDGTTHTHHTRDFLIAGTQKGTGTTITDPGKQFKSCGTYASLAVRNITDSTSGHIVSVTEDAAVTDITFHVTDVYEIYKTTTYGSKLATVYVDRRAGQKVNDPSQTDHGILVEDVDLDENEKNVFGPGQPWRD
jgi:hypothetical protein